MPDGVFDYLLKVTADTGTIAETLSKAELAQMKKEFAHPSILPAAFDITIEAWLHRISMWGVMHFKYKKPGNWSARTINQTQFLDIMFDDALLPLIGKWHFKDLKINKLSIYREYIGANGKKKKQEFILTIDLRKEIKQLLK